MTGSRLLVVVPVHGSEELTLALLSDLERERDVADVVVVDNEGSYVGAGWEQVVRPASNLGWAGGTNAGTEAGRTSHHAAVVWLNNDTRLSRAFLRGLDSAAGETGAGLVAPVYDCHWAHQRVRAQPPERYRPRAHHRSAPFVDGTCMYVPVAVLDQLGGLDASSFGPLGWGAEIDYGLRVREAGLLVAVTRRAFLHHERAVTAKRLLGADGYRDEAWADQQAGLTARWGADWRARAGIDPTTEQTTPWRQLPRLRRSGGRPG